MKAFQAAAVLLILSFASCENQTKKEKSEKSTSKDSSFKNSEKLVEQEILIEKENEDSKAQKRFSPDLLWCNT